MTQVTRRDFLKYANSSTLALSLRRLTWIAPTAIISAESASASISSYDNWEDLYRHQWQWDEVVKSTHHVNCWYQRGCTFNVYVKDGIVLREEQSATYEQTNPDVPDFNPRGCQKGACYSDRMYDAGRLKYPLKRVGERGEGKWKKVSWDEALTDIADRVIDVLLEEGPGAIYFDNGGGGTSGAGGTARTRMNKMLDTISLDIDAEVGDHHPGANVVCGKMFFTSSGDDNFYSDLILNWGGNPVYTQIPNAHFITEARYNGARIVTIAPDHNATAVHSDDWIPVNIGSDASFGLAMAQVIIEEGIYDRAFVSEQTDLPLLVRVDNRQFLRGPDTSTDRDEELFFLWDEVSNSMREAPRASLDLGKLRPALEGEFDVETPGGTVKVTTVFSMLREHLKQYTPELSEKHTGTPPSLVRKLAREIAAAKSASALTQSNFSKFYHGLEMERVQFLVFALCGQFGKKGSGINAFPFMTPDGSTFAGMAAADDPTFKNVPRPPDKSHWQLTQMDGTTFERMMFDMMRKGYQDGGFIASSLLFHEHGGLEPITGSARQWDPYLKREAADYLEEAYEKGWQVRPPQAPKIFFESGGNILRRVRGDRLTKEFLPNLPFLVTVDWRMSNTALYSDYVLPAAGWYETNDLVFSTPIAPFTNVTSQIVQPLGDSKTDWAINCLMMEKIQERAKARNQTVFKDRKGNERRLDNAYDEFSFNRTYESNDDEALLAAVVEASSNLDTTWQQLKKDGHHRYTGPGNFVDLATDIKPNETITACTYHTEHKMPWPTMTRRMQFYIDHEIYFELGEELPVHKDNPMIGGDYPLGMTGGHTRWSIHSIWRDNSLLLSLQQGEPVMWISSEDARSRGIADGDRVRVSNDTGKFETRVKISPSIRPGQTVVYHAWEPYQFPNRESFQGVITSPFNPIQMAGGYSHLQPRPLIGQPPMVDRGVRIDMKKIS